MQNGSNSNQEMVINLGDLFFYLLKKWPVILAALVIGGLIGGVLSYQDTKNNEYAALEQKVQNLKPEDLNQEKIRQYLDYSALYDQQVAYEEESYRMRMNPNEVWSGNLSYFVTCTSDTIDGINAAFTNGMSIEDRKKQLLETTELDCTEQAFSELYDIQFLENPAQYQINGENERPMERSGAVSVSVWAPDEESCKMILSGIQTHVEAESEKAAADDPENYSISLTENQVQFGRSEDLVTSQEKAAAARKGYLKEKTDAWSALSEMEQAYCDYSAWENSAHLEENGFSIKKPVIGAVAGAFLIVLICFLCYLLNGKVKTVDEVCGLPILAYLNGEEKKSCGLTKLIKKWESKYLPEVNDASYISTALSSKTFEKGLLLADISDASIKNIADQLLQEDGRLCCVGLLGNDGETVKALQESDAVILLVPFGKMSKAKLSRELEIIRNNGKDAMGAIAVRSK